MTATRKAKVELVGTESLTESQADAVLRAISIALRAENFKLLSRSERLRLNEAFAKIAFANQRDNN